MPYFLFSYLILNIYLVVHSVYNIDINHASVFYGPEKSKKNSLIQFYLSILGVLIWIFMMQMSSLGRPGSQKKIIISKGTEKDAEYINQCVESACFLTFYIAPNLSPSNFI